MTDSRWGGWVELMRRTWRSLILIGAILAPSPASADGGPADSLFRLVPPDAVVTLAVENLRARYREVGSDPILAGLGKSRAVRAWLESPRARQLARSARDIESALGVSIASVRDEILGDAVVLALVPGPPEAPEKSRGLLLAQPRDRALLSKLVEALNAAQTRGGELAGVEKRRHADVAYSARTFKVAGRSPDYYAILDDGAFAWSNSEGQIRDVIDRKLAGRPSLKDDPAFLQVRRGLPEGALASLHVSPRVVEKMLARPGRDGLDGIVARYLGAIRSAGLALEWKGGPVLHSHEAIDPARLDPWLRGWLTAAASPPGRLGQVPESALAVVSARIEPDSIRAAILELTPEADRPALDNARLALQGLLLGIDPKTEVLHRLSPHVLAYVEGRPEGGDPFPIVATVGWSVQAGEPDLSSAIDNAIRTAMAIYALDPARQARHLRVESRAIGPARVTTLTDGLSTSIAYRVEADRLILGTAADAVARFAGPRPPSTFQAVRDRSFPEAETFAIVDLDRLARLAETYRGPIVGWLAARSQRPIKDVDRDLGQLLVLTGLFRSAWFSTQATRDASAIHRTLGLSLR